MIECKQKGETVFQNQVLQRKKYWFYCIQGFEQKSETIWEMVEKKLMEYSKREQNYVCDAFALTIFKSLCSIKVCFTFRQ